jgi:single-stranded-DNA-specific exonuclease
MEKKWKIKQADAEKVSSLKATLGVHSALCTLLVQRGIYEFDTAKEFFRPKLEDLHSPWLMKDMEKAVARIDTAIKKEEKILVYGDYDVDGTTSVASMYLFLKKIYPSVDFYIPHRYKEGYGISKIGIDYAKENGFSLVISLDCGIKSAELIAYASTLGIDFIVCDHHMPDDEIPKAVAILNAKQKDCPYPYKELCGCGVGFKLMQAIEERFKLAGSPSLDYLDLVATAIAADIVPMTGENRIIAYHGLVRANTNPNLGIAALAKLSGLSKELRISNLIFMIAPRVNAAGRMDDAGKAVQLFIAPDAATADDFASQLHSDNTDRREADKSITIEALQEIENLPNWQNRKSTLVYQPHWHKGVVGIVASRLVEQYYRPTIVLTKSGDIVAGSARSVPGFNLYEAIHACKEHLIGYGGHFAAAGMTLLPEQVDAFREKFEAVVAATITDDLLVPEIVIDTTISISDIKQNFFSILCQMEPFGPENLPPVFIARNVRDAGYSKIVKEEHVKFSITDGVSTIGGIGFNLAEKFPLLQNKKPIDIVFTIDENEWNGNVSLQIKVIDFREAE